jgi:snurportin-1
MLEAECGAAHAFRGNTISRLESGKVLHVFPSALPNGSQKTRKAPSVFCIFDAVFSEAEEAYYITDVLAWNGVQLCGADIDSRMTWTRSHFERCPASDPPSAAHKYQLHMCDMHVCSAQGACMSDIICARFGGCLYVYGIISCYTWC